MTTLIKEISMNRYALKGGIAFLFLVCLSSFSFAQPDFTALLKAVDDMGNFGGQDVSITYTVVDTKPGKPDSVYQWSFFRRDYKDQIVIRCS